MKPSESSSFIKFDEADRRFNILKDAKTEKPGIVTIQVILQAYTTDKVPRLREKKYSF
jgi:hypothetical protein